MGVVFVAASMVLLGMGVLPRWLGISFCTSSALSLFGALFWPEANVPSPPQARTSNGLLRAVLLVLALAFLLYAAFLIAFALKGPPKDRAANLVLLIVPMGNLITLILYMRIARRGKIADPELRKAQQHPGAAICLMFFGLAVLNTLLVVIWMLGQGR